MKKIIIIINDYEEAPAWEDESALLFILIWVYEEKNYEGDRAHMGVGEQKHYFNSATQFASYASDIRHKWIKYAIMYGKYYLKNKLILCV